MLLHMFQRAQACHRSALVYLFFFSFISFRSTSKNGLGLGLGLLLASYLPCSTKLIPMSRLRLIYPLVAGNPGLADRGSGHGYHVDGRIGPVSRDPEAVNRVDDRDQGQ